MTVLFPLPLSPTSATFWPAVMDSDNESSVNTSGLDGYLKDTFFSWIVSIDILVAVVISAGSALPGAMAMRAPFGLVSKRVGSIAEFSRIVR